MWGIDSPHRNRACIQAKALHSASAIDDIKPSFGTLRTRPSTLHGVAARESRNMQGGGWVRHGTRRRFETRSQNAEAETYHADKTIERGP